MRGGNLIVCIPSNNPLSLRVSFRLPHRSAAAWCPDCHSASDEVGTKCGESAMAKRTQPRATRWWTRGWLRCCRARRMGLARGAPPCRLLPDRGLWAKLWARLAWKPQSCLRRTMMRCIPIAITTGALVFSCAAAGQPRAGQPQVSQLQVEQAVVGQVNSHVSTAS